MGRKKILSKEAFRKITGLQETCFAEGENRTFRNTREGSYSDRSIC